ncbi:unnamed protein product [Peniophora sp. CBMAI 1063]|nr:unnamed protein product [Peniophora sp. CBMAI 1063]
MSSASGSNASTAGLPQVGKRPAKRARTKKVDAAATSKTPANRGRKQGRLSVLPTLPMDLLYEIFAHLGPPDLLSLARTTKSFRSILMSRQSAFIWRSVLDAASEEAGHPPRPENMDEPAWTQLVFGGGKCGSCGGKTSKEILWAIRIRLCKTCQSENLLRINLLPRPEKMDPKTSWRDVIPFDTESHSLERIMLSINDNNTSDRYHPFVLKSDCLDYMKKLKTLSDAGGDFDTLRTQLDQDRKTRTLARLEHAKVCYAAEDARLENRETELGDLKKTRFEQIKSRLLAMGYDVVDMEHGEFKRHQEVRAAKPMTDKIWSRVGPILSAVIEDIRDRRLERERVLRMEERQDAVEEEYNDAILRALPWPVVAFVPHLKRIWEHSGLEGVKEILEADDTSPTAEYRVSIRQSLLSSIMTIEQSILNTGNSLRSALPVSWSNADIPTSQVPLSYQVQCPDFALDLSPLATLDRAAFVFRCQHPASRALGTRPIHFGLDGLAHDCISRKEHPIEPVNELRSLVVHMLDLLGLDPATATPVDMDRLAPVFICMHGHTAIYGASADGVAFTNWRDAVAHGDTSRTPPDHRTGSPTYRLASEMEARYVRAHAVVVRGGARAKQNGFGCCHCTKHFDFRTYGGFLRMLRHVHSWMTMEEMRDHLRTSHEIENCVEGQDYYYNRSNPANRFEHRLYENTSYLHSMSRHYAGPIRLPAVPADELETLVLAKEAAAHDGHITSQFAALFP